MLAYKAFKKRSDWERAGNEFSIQKYSRSVSSKRYTSQKAICKRSRDFIPCKNLKKAAYLKQKCMNGNKLPTNDDLQRFQFLRRKTPLCVVLSLAFIEFVAQGTSKELFSDFK